MQWQDRGFVIHARRFSDSLFILTLLTKAHGRHLGVIRIAPKRAGGLCERGNLVSMRFRARLEDQLGRFEAELDEAYGAALMDSPVGLLVLESACVLLDTLPERDPCPRLFSAFHALVSTRAGAPGAWARALLRFEITLLREMGYGLAPGALTAQTHTSKALTITGDCFRKRVYAPLGKPLPLVRKRLAARLSAPPSS